MKTIIVAIGFFVLGSLFQKQFFDLKTDKFNAPIEPVKQAVQTNEFKQLPWLDLPLEYFSRKNIEWGSVINSQEEDITDWSEVALDNKTVYQSYLTLDITISDFSSEKKPLVKKSFDAILKEYRKDEEIFSDARIRENYQTYGELSTNYLPDYYIAYLDEFDVDGDGQKETIVNYNVTGAADGGSYNNDIIKGGKIIFSVKEDNSSIIQADTNNGFYVEWANGEFGFPRCCAEGKMRTRFVWKNNRFSPLYEQEVRFFKIGKDSD
jgi:hypothetical protein